MKGLIGIGAILGLLTATAHAAPEEVRIECDGEPRIEGTSVSNIEISTAEYGLLRIVDGDDEGDEGAVTPKELCDAYEGIDAFILPAPRVLDEPHQPGEEDELELQAPDRPDRAGEKPFEAADDQGEAADDPGGDDAEGQDASGESGMGNLGDVPDEVGQYKSIDYQMNSEGCSQTAVGNGGTGWWWALLPMLLMVRRRGEGAR